MTERIAMWRSIPADARESLGGRHRRSPHVATGIADRIALSTFGMITALLLHLPLALAMQRVPSIATAHALAVLTLGTWWAVSRAGLDRLVMVVAYIAGAEVLWRMTGAQVNWEFGKYVAAAIMLLALLRNSRLAPPLLPLAYFALLLPSVALTVGNEEWATARDQISFNLSGPFALLMCAWFFSAVRLSELELRRFWLALIAPAIGVAALTASGTFSASSVVRFSDSSNFVTSGGFGPNQVSATLGLGALAAFYLALDNTLSRTIRYLMGGLLVALAAESALTFSRGGLYMAAGGGCLALIFALKDARLRSKLIPVIGVAFIVANYAVLPYLDAFTGGEMSVRFQDTELTGRDRLIQADIDLWMDHPIVGVGPGQGRFERARVFAEGAPVVSRTQSSALAAHTEFSRLVSEHGVFGLGSLLVLVAAAVINVKRAPDPRARAVVGGLVVWSALFMASYAMRTLAPSLAFGIGFAAFVRPSGEVETQAPTAARRGGALRRLTAGHPSLRKPQASGRLA